VSGEAAVGGWDGEVVLVEEEDEDEDVRLTNILDSSR
jgi:hypothetical protein